MNRDLLNQGGDGFMVVTKVGAVLPMSAEVWPVHVETGRERAYANSLAHEQIRLTGAAMQVAYANLWSDLLAMANVDAMQSSGAVLAVLELHAPDVDRPGWGWGRLSCGVCQDGDMDMEDFPCRTVEVIAKAYGIDVPEVIR